MGDVEVVLRLSKDEALVLSEWLHRREALLPQHYDQILDAARASLRDSE